MSYGEHDGSGEYDGTADGTAEGAGTDAGTDTGTETDSGTGSGVSGGSKARRPRSDRGKTRIRSDQAEIEKENRAAAASRQNRTDEEAEIETERFLNPVPVDVQPKGATTRTPRRSNKARQTTQIEQIVGMICSASAALFPPIRNQDGSLLWDISPAEQAMLVEPLAEMYPAMNPKAAAAIAKIVNPVSLCIAAYAIFAPRVQITRQWLNYQQEVTGGIIGQAGTAGGGGDQVQPQKSDTGRAGTSASEPKAFRQGLSDLFSPNS